MRELVYKEVIDLMDIKPKYSLCRAKLLLEEFSLSLILVSAILICCEIRDINRGIDGLISYEDNILNTLP